MTIKDANLTINVRDMNKSILFYESIGFALKDRWGDHYAQLTAKGIVVGLHPSNNSEIKMGSGNVSIGFTTDNFEETKSELQNLAIEFKERQEEGGAFIHFNDPDGTALYFIKAKW